MNYFCKKVVWWYMFDRVLYTPVMLARKLLMLNPSRHFLVQRQQRRIITMCEICSKLTIKTPERRKWRRWSCPGVSVINFEQISHIALVFLLLTLNKWMPAGTVTWKKRKLLKLWDNITKQLNNEPFTLGWRTGETKM